MKGKKRTKEKKKTEREREIDNNNKKIKDKLVNALQVGRFQTDGTVFNLIQHRGTS